MQQNLLDTHTLIWYINGDVELSNSARNAIEKVNATNFLSIASLWEIAIKISLGKLELRKPFSQLHTQIVANNFELLPITFEDTLTISMLSFEHRDPFDRLIIAQAMNNNLTVISRDKHFSSYKIKTLW